MNHPSNDTPSSLLVSDEAWTEVRPTSAFLHVRLTADRFFSGRAALQKAEELKRLVVALSAADIRDDAVALQGASIDVSSGLFTRSSSVTYRVRIQVKEIERLAEALDAIAECKRATLDHIEWDYPHGGHGGPELLAEAASRAMTKGKALAAALGVTVRGVRSCREEGAGSNELGVLLPQASYGGPPAARGGGVSRARMSIASEIGGLDLAPMKQIGLRVFLELAI
ncbi:MAG: SIMPL domain-containing protein [Deltaproteobacteria bacterium]|nr:SIMPL domain-containing protein [Deltaproteobacteria bacterium]